MKADNRVQEIHRSIVDQDGKGWNMHASSDPVDPMTVKFETL